MDFWKPFYDMSGLLEIAGLAFLMYFLAKRTAISIIKRSSIKGKMLIPSFFLIYAGLWALITDTSCKSQFDIGCYNTMLSTSALLIIGFMLLLFCVVKKPGEMQ